MPEFNVLSAIAIGVIAAAIWAVVFIRRSLRAPANVAISVRRRVLVWIVAAAAFLPALLVAFACSVAATRFTVAPGPWNHLAMALTVALGLGFLGALGTWGVAVLCARLLRPRVSLQ